MKRTLHVGRRAGMSVNVAEALYWYRGQHSPAWVPVFPRCSALVGKMRCPK